MSNIHELSGNGFNQNDPEIVEINREAIRQAHQWLYSSRVIGGKTAEQRGVAIRAINQMAINLGFDDLVRND